jgi:outer membrane protein assembly factor BamB
LIVIALALPVLAGNWPQWRGPDNDGVSTEKNIPAEWGPDKNIVWTLTMPGMAGSTPVVWGDRIFLTSEDGTDLSLLCIGTNGKQIWKKKVGSTNGRRVRSDEGNEASSSPSTDGSHVWAFVGSGDFACFDFDGNEKWRFNAQDRYGKFNIQFGVHTTPVLYGDKLYMQLIHTSGQWVIAIDKETGKNVWKVARPSDGRAECEHSYASPCVWHDGKDAYLIVHGNDYATAHRLDNGAEIWRLGGLNPKAGYNPTLRFVASPVATKDLIVVPTAKNGPVVGVKPNAAGSVVAGSEFEQWRRSNNTPDVPSPLVHDGLVYLCRESGILLCMDAKTGKELYSQRIHNQRHRASPVYADGKVFCTARDGVVTVVQAGPEFKILATNKLPDDFTASPVVVDGRIYLRGFKTLYSIGSK